MSIEITSADPVDAPEILALQRLAYQTEAELYHDFAIPPLTQTIENLQAEFAQQTILRATHDGRIVGSVRAFLEEATCHIGRLIVHPDLQRQGIGTQLMQAIEAAFPDARQFELFTGHMSEANLRLYTRLGYRRSRAVRVSDRLTLVYLQKPGPAADACPP